MIMKNQKYTVKLSIEERKELESFIKSKSPKATEECKCHAKIIKHLDENGKKPLSPGQTAQKVKIHVENVYKIRKQFCVQGMDRILHRKKRETPPVPAKVTGEVEAHIIATACSEVPEGSEHWTLQMIANKVVLEGIVESISDETVRRTLKKRNISLT